MARKRRMRVSVLYRSRQLFLILGALSLLALSGCTDDPEDDDDDSSIVASPTAQPTGQLNVSPTEVTFPETLVGESATETLVLTNMGTGRLSLFAVYFSNNEDGSFRLADDSPDPSGSTLQGEESITITLEFSPDQVGDQSGTLRIASDDPETSNFDIPVNGVGLGAASPDNDDDGYTVDDGDCDDDNSDIYPGAAELCNGLDDDCDNFVDEEAQDAHTYYYDGDGDGFGDSETSKHACDAPNGYVENASDCDDTNSDVHPDADEVCDGVDNDCDGWTDDG